jgi:hypothetical protein
MLCSVVSQVSHKSTITTYWSSRESLSLSTEPKLPDDQNVEPRRTSGCSRCMGHARELAAQHVMLVQKEDVLSIYMLAS